MDIKTSSGTRVKRAARQDRAALPDVPFHDVRLRRELTHRRLATSLLRRFLRVVSLHLLDGMLVGLVLFAVARMFGAWDVVEPFVPLVVASFLLSLNALRAYAPGDSRRDGGRLASAAALASLLLGVLVTFPPRIPMALPLVAGIAAAGFLALALGRKGADLLVRQAYARGVGLRRTLIVGSLDEAGSTIRSLRGHNNFDQYVVGHLTPGGCPDPASMGTLGELERILDEVDVAEVLVATTLTGDELHAVAASCFERGVKLFVTPPMIPGTEFYAEPRQVGGCAMIRLHPARLELPSLLVKRMSDIVLATLALVVLSPLLALIAAAIKLESAGPALFRQERVGLGGRPFTMWKFRSMTYDAEARLAEVAHLNIYGNQALFKLVDDPRITRVGAILRRTSLDELPQLINVLRGEMSLVGPRPLPLTDMDRFEARHFERLAVTPGITGPWQVSGRNLVTDFDEVLRMERSYIAEWSLWLDVRIMLRTLVVVLRGEGAY
jgi:exopolysaccharide biosynthesis polyprenyl glycosylphosphotransferase